MTRNLLIYALAGLAFIASGCGDNEELQSAAAPEISLDNISVENNSVSFDVISSNSIYSSYLVARADELPENMPVENILFNGTEVVQGRQRVTVSELDWDKTYKIQVAAMSYSGEYATASESFFVNLDWQEFANPANTYIVSSEGFYGFEPKKIDGTPIRIASADWIWASSDEAFAKKQNIISDVSYSSGAIKFHATGNEGNAVICGFDAGGNVVWSWLIWCTDKPKDVLVNDNTYFLDRVIGATGATQEEGRKAWSTILYQYGRISPIFGGYEDEWGETQVLSEARKYTVFNSAYDFAWTLDNGQAATREEADAHPTTFYTGVDNKKDGVWYSGPWNWEFLGSWYGTVRSWDDRDRFKTNVDPCPYGYRVPAGSDWGKTADFESRMEKVGTTDDPIGWYYTFNGEKSWFPCGNSGRICYSGELARGFGGITFLWNSTMFNLGDADFGKAADAYPTRWSFGFEGIGYGVETPANPGFGLAVRCVRIDE